MKAEPILLYEIENNLHKLKIHEISDANIGDVVNGESSSHIYHVKMITELILRELRVFKPELSLTDEEISAISMASSLHDIGKTQIPKSILDKPGALSPLEYDIVKKHSVFGEKLILEAEAEGIDDIVIEYAAKIAKYHHERIDGTGYPEGLKGEAVPVCAQIVALADAYDALTSMRSYKKAFSQDVALQMISSGMSGVFDKDLVECLVRVVNHKTLIEFREKILKAGRVTEDAASVTLKRVLIAGNTEYLTKAFIENTFPKCKVKVAGNTKLADKNQIKLFNVRKPSVKAILETYEFDLILFISRGLHFHCADPSDAEELREVLKYTSQLQKHARVLYLSTLDASFEGRNDKAIITEANEKLCEFYAGNYSLDTKIIRVPYLYSGTYKDDFLYRVFEKMHNGQVVDIPAMETTAMHFISLADLSDLLIRVIDNWTKGSGVLSVGDEFHITFSDFARKLKELDASVNVTFRENGSTGHIKSNNTVLRSAYGWFAKISVLEDMAEQYDLYLATRQEKKFSFMDEVRAWISEHEMFMKCFELVLMFIISEVLIYVTDSAVIFSIVDFRIIFIVIMATLYGLSFGIAAATMSSVSYFVARVMAGTSPLTIFYEPTNWLAFVFFFLVGGICGYVNLKKEDTCSYLEEQNKLLENKLTFTGEIYEDILRDKKELKKQIISSKDSFGKIFDITRKLNTVEPQRLYLRIIETFEEILENKSITVYSVNSGAAFGRLEVSSRDLLDTASRSIDLKTYEPVIEKIKNEEIWKNTSLNTNYPMYASGVFRGDELILVIFLWHANIEQRSLYYVNLFKILCDLVQMSLLRAYDYNVALIDKQFMENTRIMKPEFFEECIKNFTMLAEKKVSTHIMLEFDLKGHTIEEAYAMISSKIRATDIVGLTSDGKLRLLLSQATEKDLTFILPRFEGLDIITTVIK